MAESILRIGTRGSKLALWQTDRVAALLREAHPGLETERVVIQTVGDRVLDTALSKIGDKGLFTRELEEALRTERIDLAVHSLKDLPTALPDDLTIGAVLEREDPRDALVSREGRTFAQLAPESRVGTSSLRRRSQLLAARPELSIVDLRGNVPTRVDRVTRGEMEAAVLARAGLVRLGLDEHISEVLEPELMLPAVGQGALAVEARANDQKVLEKLAPLEDPVTRIVTAAERGLLARLEGGCQVPVGALATLAEGRLLTLRGLVGDVDGGHIVRDVIEAEARDVADAARIGTTLAERLLAAGAGEILDRIRAPDSRPVTG